MVLPVAYTKGLEFDAVLLFDPSERKYPADDSHVKLLYVAATRALHELAVFHRGRLTRLLQTPLLPTGIRRSFLQSRSLRQRNMKSSN